MCGIAGWVDYRRDLTLETAALERMSESVSRRGPDARGEFIENSAALLHRRLAVVDKENGGQPMTASKGGETYTLIYNGELYNTEEIRKELKSFGCSFFGHSDTEVLLWAYIIHGKECLRMLNGIYAFAVWKSRSKELFCARDRIGVKPFFFYEYKKGLAFGSEIKALLSCPAVPHQIDNSGLKQIFLLGPGRTPGSGVIRGVRELEPGEYLTFTESEGLKTNRYWKIEAKEHTETEKQTVEHTRALVEDAVRRQLISDVPLGCFLSGGLDSSIICAIAAQEYKKEGRRLDTYSVTYENNDRYFKSNAFQPDSDDVYAAIMSAAIESSHTVITLNNTKLADALSEAEDARDLPGMADIDSSLLLFCREIKKNHTVCVSGECADELFGGYPWYHREEALFADTFPWAPSLELRKKLVKPGVLDGDTDDFVRSRYFDTVNSAEKLDSDSRLDRRMREMFMLNFRWFMQTLLDRKDRMSMYSGLEVRVPFCDHRLAEYAYNMPWKYKSLEGREKGVLREAFKDLLPEKIAWRKKNPYPKTFDPAYTNRALFAAMAALDRKGPVSELIDRDFLETLTLSSELPVPWYGQLMRLPQMLAYIVQLDMFLTRGGFTIRA